MTGETTPISWQELANLAVGRQIMAMPCKFTILYLRISDVQVGVEVDIEIDRCARAHYPGGLTQVSPVESMTFRSAEVPLLQADGAILLPKGYVIVPEGEGLDWSRL